MFKNSKEFVKRIKEVWYMPHEVNGKRYDPLTHVFKDGGYTTEPFEPVSVVLSIEDCKNLRALMSQLASISVRGVDCPTRYRLISDYEMIFEQHIPYEDFERLHK